MRHLVLLAIAMASLTAWAQTYRWVDPATGKTVISDSPPPATAKSVVRKEAELAVGSQSYAVRRAAENFPVTLYTAANCTDACKLARELLNSRGVPFEEKMVQKREDVEELKKLAGENTTPVLTVGKQLVRGFQVDAYNNLLDLAGYPATAPAGSKPSGGLAK